jgi:FlaA1/EpsC-like NDP-sugar epimerase
MHSALWSRVARAIPRLTPQTSLVFLHDLTVTALALIAAFYIRFEQTGLGDRARYFVFLVPGFVLYAGVVFLFSGLYRSKWRFASLPDLFNIFRASTILALSMLALDYILFAPYFYGDFYFGKVTIALYWVLQMFFLGGPRIAYRYFRHRQSSQHVQTVNRTPALVVGNAADADTLLRSIEAGFGNRIFVAGILSPSPADRRQTVRGVDVIGSPDRVASALTELEARGIRVASLILTPSALTFEAQPELLIMRARRFGASVTRPQATDDGTPIRLAPIRIEDLLLRPSVTIDPHRATQTIAGKAVIVTGGGGSIGSEICRRVVAYGAARLLVVENSEPSLHTITEELATLPGACVVTGRIADVRDRDRIHRLFAQFEPDLVFHAAALKHVPIVEHDWAEGVKTNVFGTINVADAASVVGAESTVLISTDKAVEPMSMLGATKRFAELYCQALDIEAAADARARRRIISVRFGNVLGSTGSVVPKFRAQIEAGGPVTVTHPDMVRYFMTIREACDLVISATGHATAVSQDDLSVYVLNMGQPVKINELAEHMIRMHGLEPKVDIDIVYTGLRPGERIKEILFAREERLVDIGVPGVVAASAPSPSIAEIKAWITALQQAVARDDRAAVYRILADAVPDFRGKAA